MNKIAKLLKTLLAVFVVAAITMISAGCTENGGPSGNEHPSSVEQPLDEEHPSDKGQPTNSEHPSDTEQPSKAEHPE